VGYYSEISVLNVGGTDRDRWGTTTRVEGVH
jgi:hypothetical protein